MKETKQTDYRNLCGQILETLHALFLLTPVSVLLYTISDVCREKVAGEMFWIALVILGVSAAWLRFLAHRAKGFLLYALGGCLPIPILYLGYLWWKVRYEGMLVAAFLTGVLALEWGVLFIEGLLIRIDENEAKRARREHDISYREPDRMFRKPLPGMAFYFAVLYIIGLFFKGKTLCDVSLELLIAYVLVLVLYQYLKGTENFLRTRHSLENVPRQRIWRIGTISLFALILPILFAALMAFASSGARVYPELPEIRRVVDETEEEIMQRPDIPGVSQGPEDLEELGLLMEDRGEPWIGWNVIFYTLVILVLVVVAYSAIQGLRKFVKDFRLQEEENGDEVISLDPADEISRDMGAENRFARYFTERERIRRKYKRVIRGKAKEKIDHWRTPEEIEHLVGLSEDPDMKELHQMYERARYSRE